MNKIKMEFKRLIIVGIDREYCCSFQPGLNLIWGDLDSGKSSILNLIDFALGGKFGDLDNDEITAYGRTVCLELMLNKSTVTLCRVLGEKVNLIKVYDCDYANINEHYPQLCSASPGGQEPDGWISNLLLDYLEIPKVRLKQSKLRDDSDSSRLSFRDLMKLIHLKQKSVASDNLMDLANGFKFNRNVEVQKFIYGVHDDQVSKLNEQIKEESLEFNSLSNQAKSVDSFLQATGSKVNYDGEVSTLHEELESVDEEIKLLKSDSHFASATSSKFSSEIRLLSKNIDTLEKNRDSAKTKLVDYKRLKASYDKDLSCIKDSIMMRDNLNDHELLKKEVSCPTCNGAIKLGDEVLTAKELEHEQRSIKNRISGCTKAIDKIKDDVALMDQEIKESRSTFEEIRGDFEKSNLEVLSPIIEMISKAEAVRRSLSSKLVELKKNSKLVQKLDEMYTRIESKKIHVIKLKTDLEKIESQLLSTDDIIKDLSKYFKGLMNDSKLTRIYGSSIDKKFMPNFRERSYSKNSSGGVRTLMSVYLYISRLKFLLQNGGYLPTTLLLDTPGQNIGKYAREGEESSVSDPAIYEQIYKGIVELSILTSKEDYQIIVVDNDLATSLNQDDYFLVKRFDKTEKHGEKGLISNADLPEKF
jgi:NAD-dependent SIR2 family protein deacetylase